MNDYDPCRHYLPIQISSHFPGTSSIQGMYVPLDTISALAFPRPMEDDICVDKK
jgi:hypothetical protein